MESGRDIGRACVMFNIRKAARGVTRRYEAALRPLGLKAGQFSIMAALMDVESAPIGTVAEMLGMDRTTLNRNLKPLERRGLVASRIDEADRRTRRLALTEPGRTTMAEAIPLWRQAQAESFDRIPPEHWRDIKAHLDALG